MVVGRRSSPIGKVTFQGRAVKLQGLTLHLYSLEPNQLKDQSANDIGKINLKDEMSSHSLAQLRDHFKHFFLAYLQLGNLMQFLLRIEKLNWVAQKHLSCWEYISPSNSRYHF